MYFDARTLELGAVVNGTVLARPGTLAALLGVRQETATARSDVLPTVLSGAAVLVEAEALVASGLSAEDLESLNRAITELSVVPASAQAGNPALAAATVPLEEAFGV